MKIFPFAASLAILALVTVLGACSPVTSTASLATANGQLTDSLRAQQTALQQPTPTAPSIVIGDIGVTGTGHVSVQPDTALITLGAETTLPALTDATADVSKRSTAILDKVKSLGVDAKDITTVNYSVYPQTSANKAGETPRITGYHVTNIVRIKVRKLDDVGKIMDAAVNAGANNIGGISFTIDDSSQAEANARALAVKAAMAKAKQLADAANVKLGDLASLTESVAPRPVATRSFAAAPASADSVAPGPVESGSLDISVTVEMHYTIAK